MGYLVLARKYRPQKFDEVIGQDHITDLLKKSITSGHVSHAYLFCGPRGIGKTSCARILAKSLNCKNGPTVKPCGKCAACKEITQANSFDVLEIDGASNRGIDEIRTIRENVKFAPSYGRYKIYIVDEVHMLTTEAFNALLKTLEEPPEHVIFIFATTDPNKLPPTIISRCQRFDFKRIPLKICADVLKNVAKKEGLEAESDALYAVARASSGSLRDGLSILDQVSAIQDRKINGEDIYSMLGLVELDLLFELTEALGTKDCTNALKIFDSIIEKGKDVKQLGRDLIEHCRNLMIMKVGGKSLGRLLDYPVEIKEQFLAQSAKWLLKDILKAIDILITAQEISRLTETLRTPLEIAFAKITYDPEQEGALLYDGKSLAPSSREKSPTKAALKTNFSSNKNPHSIARQSPLKQAKTSDKKQTAVQDGQVSLDAEENYGPMGNIKEEAFVDIDKIRESWDALTYAVSREKMSIATYLQEGQPYFFEGGKLTIGFQTGHDFYKEALETQENIKLLEQVFSEKLRARIIIEIRLVDKLNAPVNAQSEPMIKAALETFGGKIINQWHNE